MKLAGSPGTISMQAKMTRLATISERHSEPSRFVTYVSI
jgi:hypothetical protein